MATTAVASCWTRPWAIPPNGSVVSVRADRQALRTTIRRGSWSRRYGPSVDEVTGAAPPGLVLEVDDALAQTRVEVAVTDEVHDVRLRTPQPRAELRERRARQPVEHDQAGRGPRLEGLLDPGPLGLDVELVEVDRRGDDRQHAQRSVDRDRSRYLRHVEEPHQRRALRLRQEVVGPGVVQQLPRQPGDRRRVVEPEPEAQPAGLLGPYLVEAALPGQGEVAGEHRLVERAAEVHRGLLLARTSDPARARPSRVELEEEVLERGRVERQLEADAGGLAERGVGDARLVAAFSLLLQEQVEVEVAPGCHQLRSFACSVRTPD